MRCPLSAPLATEQRVLQANDLCGGNLSTAIATFEDVNLEGVVRAALGIESADDLTCALVSGLTTIAAENAGIVSLIGIQNLTSLTFLPIDHNSLIDIVPLSALTSLTNLNLDNNSVTVVSALSDLTGLTFLSLKFNSITDVTALGGLTGGKVIWIGDFAIFSRRALAELDNALALIEQEMR